MPSNTVLTSGPAVRAAQSLTWSYSCVFLPPTSTAIRASAFSSVGALNSLLYLSPTQSLLSWSGGFNPQLAQLMGRFGVFFLSHTAPGFHLWLYFHFYKWVVHWGLLLRLPRRARVCPSEGQARRRCSCLARGDTDCLSAGVTALSQPFFEPLVAGDRKASLASLSP